MVTRSLLLVALAILVGCGAARPPAIVGQMPTMGVRTIALPGASSGISMDYLAYDRTHGRVWVPAGETGTVAVVDTRDDHVTMVRGFAAGEMERRGTKRLVGPSSVAVGDGIVYVGDRADATVCAVDAESLKVGPCTTLDSPPDGLAYVATTKELWATTPRDQSVVVLNTADQALTRKAKIPLDGAPEGYAVDDARGAFYTNLEDRDRTLTIDLKSRRVVRTWGPECGGTGPRGLALDRERNILFVACTDHVVALDAGHDGKRLSSLQIGDGIDNIDFVASRHELYVAAAKAATLTIARLDPETGLTAVAIARTRPGARNAVATDRGVAYLSDAPEGQVLVVAPVLTR